nr:C. briggsae CBR-PQN-70 protein [Haemonchus contortus]
MKSCDSQSCHVFRSFIWRRLYGVGRGVGKGSVGASSGATNNQTDSNNESKSNAGDVPGFGTNSSIHELFGKMVWKKMEAIKDEAVIDRLQNRIMNMIHEALAQQSEASNGGGGPNPNAAVNGGKPNQSSGNFRSF